MKDDQFEEAIDDNVCEEYEAYIDEVIGIK